MEIRQIEIRNLEPNTGQIPGLPSNPRQWTKDEMDNLKKSIGETPELLEARGAIVYPKDGKYIVLGGNMRLEAVKALGWKQMPCIVLPESLPIEKLKEIVIKDNGSFGEWDMDALADAAPGALICDAPNCLKYFFLRIRDNHAYCPYVTGIYDEWNWPDRPESLSGAILLPSEKQVRLAVRELIGQIEHGSPPSSISLQSRFFPCEKFDEVPVKDLSFRHLFPF